MSHIHFPSVFTKKKNKFSLFYLCVLVLNNGTSNGNGRHSSLKKQHENGQKTNEDDASLF